MLAETPSHLYPHTYRHTWLPSLAWQPRPSICEHPGLSLHQDGEAKSVTTCATCALLWPQCQESGRERGRPWGQEMPGTKLCPPGSPELPRDPLPITYRVTFLPLWARESRGPTCPLGRKDGNERGCWV